MRYCIYCGEVYQSFNKKRKFCSKQCKILLNNEKRKIDCGKGYDPYLALWAAVMIPDGKVCRSNFNYHPEMLSKVGHELLELAATQLEREGKIEYFARVFKDLSNPI